MAPKKGIVLAEEQKKFIEKALSGKNIMLDGAEGSGKKTALRSFCSEIEAKSKVLYFTNSRFGKNDVETRLKKPNITVDYYSGFAFRELRKIGIFCDDDKLVEMFAKVKPSIKGYDYLIVAEFEDLTEEAAKMLEVLKYRMPNLKIIAYGDVSHMIAPPGGFNARTFMDGFLGKYETVEFKNCYVISSYDKTPEDDEPAGDDMGLPEDEPTEEPEEENLKDKRKRRSSRKDKKEEPEPQGPETRIAVIDTEINRNDEVMSIGLVIADALTFETIEEKYYIIEPEHTVGGEYQKKLRINEFVNVGSISRKDAMGRVRACLSGHGVRSIFAYNAISDYERLVELTPYNWYDIMQLAAYKQYNATITDDDECHESGRLKKDFNVPAMLERLGGEGSGYENNAIYDARDELEILKLMNRPIGDYVFTSVSDDDAESDLDWQSEDADLGEDALTAAEAEQLLGVSRGTVYNLVKRGEIFGYKRGQHYIISEISVREYLEKQEAAEDFRYKSTVSGILIAILFALIYLWHLAAKVF